MTAITELKNELEKGARAFKAFENGVKALSLLEGLEQNETELTKRVAALQATENDWLAKRNKALSDAEDAGKRAADNLAHAAEEVKKVLEEGRAQAAKVLGEAKEMAGKLITDAKSLAAGHAERADQLGAENEAAEASLKEKTAALMTVEKTLAEHKASLAKFLG